MEHMGYLLTLRAMRRIMPPMLATVVRNDVVK